MSEFITTYTGKHFKPTDPNPELIDIPDIAHALSLICGTALYLLCERSGGKGTV